MLCVVCTTDMYDDVTVMETNIKELQNEIIGQGVHSQSVNAPHKGKWRGANNSVNNQDAGDLRHHRAHYDVNVMIPNEENIICKHGVFIKTYGTS